MGITFLSWSPKPHGEGSSESSELNGQSWVFNHTKLTAGWLKLSHQYILESAPDFPSAPLLICRPHSVVSLHFSEVFPGNLPWHTEDWGHSEWVCGWPESCHPGKSSCGYCLKLVQNSHITWCWRSWSDTWQPWSPCLPLGHWHWLRHWLRCLDCFPTLGEAEGTGKA